MIRLGRKDFPKRTVRDHAEPLVFLHGREINLLSPTELSEYHQKVFLHYRGRGFPYPEMTSLEMRKAFEAFARSRSCSPNVAGEIGWSPLGLQLANVFHPHMWHTKCEHYRTPIEVFDDDAKFLDSIQRASRYWGDRRPHLPNSMRSMLSTYVNTRRVSNFRPTAARALVEAYSGPGDCVVDPSAGYGGRLLGVLSLDRAYIGIEPHTATFAGLKTLHRSLKKLELSQANITLRNSRAEVALPDVDKSSASLVICSPPYYSREHYGDDGDQSWVRYGTYQDWLEQFMECLISESHRILHSKGYLLLNVANTKCHPVAEDVVRIAKRYFRLKLVHRMLLGSVPYHRNGNRGGHRWEPIYVFQKLRQ
jgi:DNA modification methylase